MESVESGTVAVPAGALFYEQAGRGIPIVLISGGSMLDRRGWDEQFAELARCHRVIRYDVRGVGASSQPTGPFSPYDDLQSLLDRLGVEKAVLVGHSFAGGLAIDFCLERPQSVTAVVAVTPALGGFTYSDAFEERNAKIFRAYQSGGGEAAIDAVLSDPCLAPRDAQNAARCRSIVLDNLAMFDIDPAWMRPIELPALDRLGEIDQPFLVISAQHDDPDNRAVALLLESRLANARRVELTGAGHLAHFDQPAKFNTLVHEFIRSLSLSGAKPLVDELAGHRVNRDPPRDQAEE
jgi:pimeloyl-ACP methyl ester carboxylesterase